MIDRAHQIYPFQPYSLVILFLASCLVVGQSFYLFAWLAGMLVSFLYGVVRYFIATVFASHYLYQTIPKLQGFRPSRAF